MSEPKLISPMLDDFDMGSPICDHNGVRCCPAMRKNSDEKYIVKIISVPESQTKLDALLLTGALADNHAALSYFEELANGIIDEKRILDKLSQLDGFLSFKDCQIVPMDDTVGYDVYLISEYKRTLERQLSKRPMTQLEAVNLGLDLCAALSACRRSGYLYIDLKPSNIYIVGDNEYKIGDLGFVRINCLKYESIQDKYRSCYTAPELEDIFATLNNTVDIYAVGLILYQIFNGGILPAADKQASNIKFDAPAYADEEMARIILKACDPDPSERWEDPVQMGQAIVSYMQKNGANDTPLSAEYFGGLEDIADTVDGTTDDTVHEETPAEGDDVIECLPGETAETLNEEADEPEESTDEPDSDADSLETTLDDQILTETDSDFSSEFVNLSFLDDLEAEVSSAGDVSYEGITDEVSNILDQIDELTSHDVPAPVIAPEPIEIKIPDPISIDDPIDENTDETLETIDNHEATEIQETSESHEAATVEENVSVESETVDPATKEIPDEEKPYIPKKKRTGLVVGIIFAVVLALAAGVYYLYTNYYLQPIHSITLSGSEDSLQVTIDADIDEVLLTVVCSDSHGNKVTAPVVAGKSAFSGLAPDTAYTISVEVDGLHRLTGITSKTYSTPVQTKIMQVRAITGPENGSIILSFTVDGPDSDQWNVIYSTEGEAERVTTFTDHMITLTGLTVGKEYCFHLEPVSDIYLSGETDTTYVARNLIYAENLRITSFVDGVLSAQWDSPEGESVTNWSVRCHNNDGFNETVFTEANMISFQNLDESLAYTIEVVAADMSVNRQVSIGPNAVTISDFTANVLPSGMLSLSWNSNRDVPVGGWVINYSVNGINVPESVASAENFVEINAVPGSRYQFNIYDSNGNEVLGGPFTYTLPESTAFDAYAVTKDNITARLCKTPESEEWNHQDLNDEDYINTFAVGEKFSIVLAHDGEADASADEVLVTYAIFNEDGQLVNFYHVSQIWDEMWDNNYCELNVPIAPAEAGTYNVVLYINGAEAAAQKFEISI